MKKLHFLLCVLTCLIGYGQLNAQCDNGRYYDQPFGSSMSTVQYGNAMQWDSSYINLDVDIYQPSGDAYTKRPLLIFAFGGSFTGGVRQSPDLVYLCNAFSKRGYVCASIDYRLGYNSSGGTDTNLFQAMVRGIQDMKAAVRFFYKDANGANQYRIDTDQIFIGGVSAGAFIGLNYAYFDGLNFSKPFPGFALPSLAALGGIDGNSGNPGYSTKVKGVIDLCGAIVDTIWLQPGKPILVGVHGTADNTVACAFDSLYALQNTKSMLFGGCDINQRLHNMNSSSVVFTDSFYLFQGADHCPFILPYPPTYNPVPWMDTTEHIVRDFLYKNVTCLGETGIGEVTGNLSISVSPVPSNDIVEISSQEAKDLTVSVITADGKIVKQIPLPAKSAINLRKEQLSTGAYILQFADRETKAILETKKILFY